REGFPLPSHLSGSCRQFSRTLSPVDEVLGETGSLDQAVTSIRGISKSNRPEAFFFSFSFRLRLVQFEQPFFREESF
ncbi:MAG: hypothetical protein LBF22_13355, partial [Deltaproteobacteria bacterium]|nr:hypothetical protein [Deltaproteobacteria bacterium]